MVQQQLPLLEAGNKYPGMYVSGKQYLLGAEALLREVYLSIWRSLHLHVRVPITCPALLLPYL